MTPDSLLTEHLRLTPIQKSALKKLGIATVRDLLYHFPVRYGDTAEYRNIETLEQGVTAVVFGKISNLKASKGWKSKMTMATATIEDETGKINCIWFNQPYVAKMFQDGMLVRIEGKVSQKRAIKNDSLVAGVRDTAEFSTPSSEAPRTENITLPISGAPRKDGFASSFPLRANPIVGVENSSASLTPAPLYFSNPKIEKVASMPLGVGDSLFGEDSEKHNLYPVYPESRGITSTWMYHAIQKIFKSGALDRFEEIIPEPILEKYHLPKIKTALVWMHTPLNKEDALSARKRFSFEEIFVIQLGKQIARRKYEELPAFNITPDQKHMAEFIKRFPFKATNSQERAVNSILADMDSGKAMVRLLEGDVGSGKTAVSAASAYAVITARDEETNNPLNLQVAYMCPTEILATQHFESFIQYFAYLGIQIALITGSGCRKFPSKVNPKGWTDISRSQLLKWVANGEIAVVIGTHALIQKSVIFKKLAYVIIDEQHRFGTAQRAKLAKKTEAPHLLSMTATPIPRTLALTMYGDLDLTLLDEVPQGRKPVITELVLPSDRDATYEKIRAELVSGRQAYVICPRIDAPDPDKEMALQVKSVIEEAKRLKEKVFQEFAIGILHGKMSAKEKDLAMNEFKSGKTHILCATSVVEVGVNVPNATVIVIEGSERFGLSQLHQLRGRVLRSSHQAYCYAFTETTSAKSIERLKALKTARNGFELAELDLAQRGAGQLSGKEQWGVSDVAMEALKNLKMVEAAREEAVKMIRGDMTLCEFPTLKKAVEKKSVEAHFE